MILNKLELRFLNNKYQTLTDKRFAVSIVFFSNIPTLNKAECTIELC